MCDCVYVCVSVVVFLSQMELFVTLHKTVTQSYFIGKGSSSEKEPWHRIVVVFFLGGCTYSEIAALRFLGKQRGNEHNLYNNDIPITHTQT